ncbi:MAG: Menaquinone reductase, multiheme cytochrome c subunit [Dehalococcoidia bacterium]|nr:Menaquinone reductase, multiheme cytochrome c subunit [Dehalococcoidia bacterium]
MGRVPLSVKIAVPIAGLLLGIAALFVAGAVFKAWWSLPFDMFTVKADQPIEFPHDVHAAQLGIDCLFCHRNANKDEAASVPSVQQCMICHQVVEKGPTAAGTADIVHRLQDHVEFTHEAHIRFFSEQNNINPSQVCSTCHGDVKTMGVNVQVRNLKMRDCVDCHRDGYLSYLTDKSREAVLEAVRSGHMAPPPTDCFQCHY